MVVHFGPARLCSALLFSLAIASAPIYAQPAPAAHAFFAFRLAQGVARHQRAFAHLSQSRSGDKEVSMSEFNAAGAAESFVCAREIHDLAPGGSIEVDCRRDCLSQALLADQRRSV